MTRDEARQEIRNRIDGRRYLTKSKNGQYCCPKCGSGTGKNHSGALNYYEDTHTWFCFSCKESGDSIDLYMIETGTDYNTALHDLADELGITIDPYRATAADDFTDRAPIKKEALEAPQSDASSAGGQTAAAVDGTPQRDAQGLQEAINYKDYYRKCAERLADPAAISYLKARGISYENAASFCIGFDPAADPANAPGAMGNEYKPHPAPRLIIPTSFTHYVGRRTDGGTEFEKINSKDGKPGIFNRKSLDGDAETIFVTEGAFDALSVMETGRTAIALNSTSNAQELVKLLKEKKTTGKTFVICLDNDDPGRKATETLREGMGNLNISHITADICCGHGDPNEALVADRAAFTAAVQRAELHLPGLLTYQDAVTIFETADDRRLELKSFPEFSATAKIRLHDLIVLAADTGVGKSSLAINFLNDLNENYPCIYINLEMDAITVLQRLTAIHSGLELDRIEGYKHDEKTAAAVNVTLQAITSRKPLQVIQGAYMLQDIEDIVKQSTKGRDEPTIVIIDHSLLVDTKEHTGSRYERFTQISESLRRMALNYNIVLFVLLQQSRAGKANDEERPRNSSLKESGSWENDATHICFLWYDPADRKKKLLLTKARYGGSGAEFILSYWKKTQTYTEAPKGAAAAQPARDSEPHKQTRRERQKQKLINAYEDAYFSTFGKPTLQTIAEAADVTTSTVKTWLKEYGGFIIDGKPIDPAGVDAIVEQQEFIKLTPADDDIVEAFNKTSFGWDDEVEEQKEPRKRRGRKR